MASPTKDPIVMVAADVKKIQTTKRTRGSDMVAKAVSFGFVIDRSRVPTISPCPLPFDLPAFEAQICSLSFVYVLISM